MSEQRPADEIRPGDVIEYVPGGLMMVTRPGRAESVRFVGRRVGHHGVALTVPAGGESEGYEVGKAASTLHLPRSLVDVMERRAFGAGDLCPCSWCRGRRGDSGPVVVPPVVTGEGLELVPQPVRAAEPVRRREALEEGPGGVAYAVAVRAVEVMDPGWSAEVAGKGEARMRHVDGRSLLLVPDDRAQFRGTHVRVSPEYPGDAAVPLYDCDKPVVRFRHDRVVTALVKALEKRVFPVYDERFAVVMKATEENRQSRAADEELARELAGLVPGMRPVAGQPAWIESVPEVGVIEHVQVRASAGGDSSVSFRYVDEETVRALMRVYGEVKRAQAERSGTAG